MKLINNHRQPITLSDGTILAAAGTNGSTKAVESISDRDRRRLVSRGLVAVIEPAPSKPARAEPAAKQATEESK